MSTNVFANGHEIASKAADGQSTAAFPDTCFTPPSPPVGPPPIPYPNTTMAKDTVNGTSKVFIKKKTVAMAGVSFTSKSTGDEAATKILGGGVITKTILGQNDYPTGSMNVKMEGKEVPRNQDPMIHNLVHQGASTDECISTNQETQQPVMHWKSPEAQSETKKASVPPENVEQTQAIVHWLIGIDFLDADERILFREFIHGTDAVTVDASYSFAFNSDYSPKLALSNIAQGYLENCASYDIYGEVLILRSDNKFICKIIDTEGIIQEIDETQYNKKDLEEILGGKSSSPSPFFSINTSCKTEKNSPDLPKDVIQIRKLVSALKPVREYLDVSADAVEIHDKVGLRQLRRLTRRQLRRLRIGRSVSPMISRSFRLKYAKNFKTLGPVHKVFIGLDLLNAGIDLANTGSPDSLIKTGVEIGFTALGAKLGGQLGLAICVAGGVAGGWALLLVAGASMLVGYLAGEVAEYVGERLTQDEEYSATVYVINGIVYDSNGVPTFLVEYKEPPSPQGRTISHLDTASNGQYVPPMSPSEYTVNSKPIRILTPIPEEQIAPATKEDQQLKEPQEPPMYADEDVIDRYWVEKHEYEAKLEAERGKVLAERKMYWQKYGFNIFKKPMPDDYYKDGIPWLRNDVKTRWPGYFNCEPPSNLLNDKNCLN